MKNDKTGLSRLAAAAGYSTKGLIAAYRYEAAFRQEIWLAFMLVPAAVWLGDSLQETIWLICPVIALLIVELLNSSVEAVVDRVGDEFHELSGRAKDMGSAAVLLMMVVLVLIWLALLTN